MNKKTFQQLIRVFQAALSRQSLRWLILFLLVGAISIPFAPQTPVHAESTCVSSAPVTGAYTVTVCVANPANGNPLTGDSTITATASVNPAPIPGAANPFQKVIFYLGGEYLLTDFQAPYTFLLPTTQWVDGNYSLSVEAYTRDGFVSNKAGITIMLDNGIYTTPVNTKMFTPSMGTTPAQSSDPLVVAAVGDGAGGETNGTNVVNLIASWKPNLFLHLGDVYDDGTYTEFYNWYGHNSQLFSQFRSITNPTVGNHEYVGGKAPGYFNYWDNVPHYYSWNSRGWHFISLDVNKEYGQTLPGTSQYAWLARDLSANSASCTLVYWHQPLFNIGKESAADLVQEIWALLAKNKVDIVLTAHDHNYQRWVPMDGKGQPDFQGITQFVVGTGGHGIQTFVTNDSRVAAGFDSNTSPAPFGALRLKLYKTYAAYNFINTAGTSLDSGTVGCRNITSNQNPGNGWRQFYLPKINK